MANDVRSTAAGAVRPRDLGAAPDDTQGVTWFWLNNRPTNTRGQSYTGWGCAVGNPELDEILQAADWPKVVIKHPDKIKPYWALETATVFVACLGVPEFSEFRKKDGDRWGLRYYWEKNKEGRSNSHLQFKAFVKELPWTDLCTFSVKGKTVTEAMMMILRSHYKTLDALDAQRNTGHPFFMAGIPIGISEETISAKSRNSGLQSDVVPPVSLVPETITEAFLKSVWIGNQSRVDLIEANLEATIAWSQTVPVTVTPEEADQEMAA